MPRGARVLIKLGDIDEVTLDIHGTVIERLDTPEMTEAEGDNGEDDEDAGAGPIAIAVDMTEGDAPAAEAPGDTAAP